MASRFLCCAPAASGAACGAGPAGRCCQGCQIWFLQTLQRSTVPGDSRGVHVSGVCGGSQVAGEAVEGSSTDTGTQQVSVTKQYVLGPVAQETAGEHTAQMAPTHCKQGRSSYRPTACSRLTHS